MQLMLIQRLALQSSMDYQQIQFDEEEESVTVS